MVNKIPFTLLKRFGAAPVYVKNFQYGLMTRIEQNTIQRGAASDCLNWQFLGDHIELRRGQVLMGTEAVGSGRVSGVKVAKTFGGVQIPFFTAARSLKYYDVGTSDVIESGSNIFPTTAVQSDGTGEDIAMTPYQSLAGSFLYLSSPNSGMYRVPIANPGSVIDQRENSFRGFIKATQGRMFLWNLKTKFGGKDQTGLNLSVIDKSTLGSYTRNQGEAAFVSAGDGSTKAFSSTLAFAATATGYKKSAFGVRAAGAISALVSTTAITAAASAAVTATAHGLAVGDMVVFQGVVGMTQINHRLGQVLTVTDADHFTVDINSSTFTAYSSGGKVGKAEYFIDGRDGVLTSNLGGTGTINYATGAIALTFNTAPVNLAEIVDDYYVEDPTSTGVSDFTTVGGTFSINDSQTFRQDDAGNFQNIGSIGTDTFCFHSTKTYDLRLVSTTDITNLIWRERAGIPYWKAMVPTGEGIYYLDATDIKNPVVRIAELAKLSTSIVPRSISDQLELSNYTFDQAVMFEWGNYICLACKTYDSTVNNRLFLYNRIYKSWEVHDFRVSDMDAYYGALLGGDSGSNNLFKLFSGVADQDSIIENYFVTGNDITSREGTKELNVMKVVGLIGDDQQIDVSYSLDNAPFVLAKSIFGSGDYVDRNSRKIIGSDTLGEIIGGGQAPSNSIFASPYEIEFFVGTGRFERIRLKFEAKAVGYASVSEYGLVDLRFKSSKVPVKYYPQNQ